MLRICLCLLLVFASTAVAARDFKMSSANGGSCPDSVVDKEPVASSDPKAAPPIRESRAKAGIRGDGGEGSRLQSPRWHSFLPGMFR